MRRRAFVTGLGALLATPLAARAQPAAKKIVKIGWLATSPPEPDSPVGRRWWEEMKRFGFVLNDNARLEVPGTLDDQLIGAAADLVQRQVDVIISVGTIATQAAKNATHTIPIVMVGIGDPVASGIVADLRRPEGNVTGLSVPARPLAAKRLQLLKEALPFVKRVGVIWNPANDTNVRDVRYLEDSSPALQIELHPLRVRSVDELRQAFRIMVSKQVQAFIVVAEGLFWVLRKDLLDAALAYRLPGIYPYTFFVPLGGLMAYSWNEAELWLRSASYVGRVLSGAKVSELPVEQPTKYEFVINLKTAKALGLTIPPSLLLRADQVIE